MKARKVIQALTLALFAALLLVPVLAMRLEPGIKSEIDNRMLAENPFSPEVREKGGDLTADIESYVSDRIGFRDEMILGYTLLNDRLFGKMVHPSYTYGKDGYVFFKIGGGRAVYGEFEEAFADMVKKIQDYCEARGVPFVFAFEPGKTSVLREYLPAGIQYDFSWTDRFCEALEERGVRYVDNRETLAALHRDGVTVFNQKYDAGHWNDVGAFYGVNAILEALREDFPGVHVNAWEELTVSEEEVTSLPVSRFPIRETVPQVSIPSELEDRTWDGLYDEVARNASFPGFGYYANPERLEEGSPRALVFQGSYMLGKGAKFFQNALGEYAYVHNYQNVIDFDYYFHIFKPECVVFEVTDYAMSGGYFNADRMAAMDLNPTLSSARRAAERRESLALKEEDLSVQQGQALTKMTWTGGAGDEEYAWALLGGVEYDMRRNSEGAYETTALNEDWDRLGGDLKICTLAGGVLREYGA